ncbi:DeoR/GlpR family DNA-binding transcription regulator [Aureimonas ureilytica]|uniref:DeoR/GlpR family DNA-binding transcription regulator n=1 Tax=Aureimonas ureilytica TaxID=401562 RepID=UPI00037DCF6D|nr:DeoR/GlpR family DNA-binding transcription regulator [Aureimonas ureilytica]
MSLMSLTPERQTLIRDRLSREGRVLASELAREFAVSEDTIRRDLRELASAGLCRRVYGGALPPAPGLVPLRKRREEAEERKRALAVALAERIAEMTRPNATIFIDAGSTNIHVAEALDQSLAATVVTHAPAIACALADKPALDVVLFGGRVNRHTGACLGAVSQREAEAMRPDLLVLGICGVDAEIGITAQDYEDAAFKREIGARAGAVVAAALNEKLASVTPFPVLEPGRIDTLVVEHDAPPQALAEFEAAGIRILRARPPLTERPAGAKSARKAS